MLLVGDRKRHTKINLVYTDNRLHIFDRFYDSFRFFTMTKFSQSPIKWCWIREKIIGISYKRRIAYSYHLQFGCRHSDDVDDFRSHHHILNPTWCHHCWLAMLLLLQYLLYSLLLFLLQVLCLHLLEVLL